MSTSEPPPVGDSVMYAELQSRPGLVAEMDEPAGRPVPQVELCVCDGMSTNTGVVVSGRQTGRDPARSTVAVRIG